MVQGLGFLSKKSWHTKNLANQEKVWMAEQRKEAEAQKTKELAKQIQQEREKEEMERISGKKSSTLDRGIDWMYQGGSGDLAKEDAERKAEEFLLGKEYVGEGAAHGDFDNGDQNQGINNVIQNQQQLREHQEQEQQRQQELDAANATTSAMSFEPSVKDRNEDFRLRVEDPMFMVSQQQRQKEAQHQKTKDLYERVVGYAAGSDQGDSSEPKKRSKKDRKRHKKHHKKKSKRRRKEYDSSDDSGRDNESDEDSEDRRDRRRRRHRSHRDEGRRRTDRHSPDRDRRRHSHREDRYRNDDDGRSYDSQDRHRSYSQRDHHRGTSDPYREDRARKHDDSRYYDSRREPRRRDHDSRPHESSHHRYHDRYDASVDRNERGHRSARDSSPPRGNARETASHDVHSRKKEGYGLLGSGSSAPVDRQDLGPNQDLLKKRRDAKEAERRRIKEVASSRRRSTPEERAKALREMQANATRQDQRRSQLQQQRASDQEPEDTERGKQATFLKDLTQEAHGISGTGSSLSARVAQNRHTNQRLHDSFL